MLFATLSILLAGGIAALWFVASCEKQKPMTDEERVAKLLVGSWKMTKCYHVQLSPDGESLVVFHADGRYESQYSHPFAGLRVRTGTYRVEGARLHVHVVATERYEEMTWEEEVERITQTELTLVGPAELGAECPRFDFQRSELRTLPVPPRPPSTGPTS